MNTSLGVETTTTSPPFTHVTGDVQPVVSSPLLQQWTRDQLNILGAFLWIAIIVALVGNVMCFYAVYKNLKKILEHPFFQSNILCILLSTVDVLLVLLVGIPAALFFCTANKGNARTELLNEELGNGYFNRAVVEPILDYFVWVQLLIIVAICVDRAGHICRPLTYTFSIKTSRTALACFLCLLIPFVLQTIPHIVMVERTIDINLNQLGHIGCEPGDTPCVYRYSFPCDAFGDITFRESLNRRLFDASETALFMTCTVALPSKWGGESRLRDLHKVQWWESVSHPLILLLGAGALILSNCLIIYKLVKSSRFRRSNMSRPASIQKEDKKVSRMVRLNSSVALVQALLLLISTLPLRIYQIEHKLSIFYLDECALEENQGRYFCDYGIQNYHKKFQLIAKVLIFIGPMLNPWLYPIRMASIRTFFSAKKQSLASSVNTSLSRLRTRGTLIVSLTKTNLNVAPADQETTEKTPIAES